MKNNQAKTAKNILGRIIARGGLMGVAAQQYINDPVLGAQFIKECADYCRSREAE